MVLEELAKFIAKQDIRLRNIYPVLDDQKTVLALDNICTKYIQCMYEIHHQH